MCSLAHGLSQSLASELRSPRLQPHRAPQAHVLLPGQPQLPGDVLRVSDHAQPARGAHSRFPSEGVPHQGLDLQRAQVGCQGPFHSSGRNRGPPLRRRPGQGPHLAKRWEPRGFSRVAAGFSSSDGDLSLPLGLALGSPIFPSGCEGKLGVALESLQGRRDLT